MFASNLKANTEKQFFLSRNYLSIKESLSKSQPPDISLAFFKIIELLIFQLFETKSDLIQI